MILGILGRSRVGKDTLANILVESHGFEISRLSSPVKSAVQGLFGFDDAQIHDAAKELVDPRYGMTPRDAMVWMTGHVHAGLPKEFCMSRLLASTRSTTRIIIPDVRYAHDVERIRRMGGRVVKVTRRSAPVLHAHEDFIDSILGDILLENDVDEPAFEKLVRSVVPGIIAEMARVREGGSSGRVPSSRP